MCTGNHRDVSSLRTFIHAHIAESCLKLPLTCRSALTDSAGNIDHLNYVRDKFRFAGVRRKTDERERKRLCPGFGAFVTIFRGGAVRQTSEG